MSEKVKQVFQAYLTLNDQERDQLFDAIEEDADGHPFDEEWLAEIKRRSAAFDRGEAATVSWEEVQQRMIANRDGRG